MAGMTTKRILALAFFAIVLSVSYAAEGMGHVGEFIETQEDYENNMLWGTYRPQTYFGMRTRTPKAMLTGIMWHDASDRMGIQHIRHSCEQGDQLKKYGWNKHDGQYFGTQEIIDADNNLILTTEFAKKPGKNGGDWSVRVTGRALESTKELKDKKIALHMYFGLENESPIKIQGFQGRTKKQGFNNPLILNGNTDEVGSFSVLINDVKKQTYPKTEVGLDKYHILGSRVGSEDVWRVTDRVQKSLQSQYVKAASKSSKSKSLASAKKGTTPQPAAEPTILLPNQLDDRSNVIDVQRVVRMPFQFEVVFMAHENHPEPLTSTSEIKKVAETMSKTVLTNMLNEYSRQFDAHFETKFQQKSKGFDQDKISMSQSTLANMLGGMGYFYGTSFHESRASVNPKEKSESRAVEMPATSLFTAVPSRSFFPRGFFWDEGFHQLIVARWNPQISRDVISSWFNLMEDDGWIPREQILGSEARSKVPSEFQVQRRLHGNPPTLYMALQVFINEIKNSKMVEVDVTGAQQQVRDNDQLESMENFLKDLYPKLLKNYQWFNKTQVSHKPGSYQWKGRSPGHTFSSGLDDYPRGTPMPHYDEMHLDMYSWMYQLSGIMRDVAHMVGDNKNEEEFAATALRLSSRLDEFHWNSNTKLYADFAGTPAAGEPTEEGGHKIMRNSQGFSDHVGYVNLFPVLVGLVTADNDKKAKYDRYIDVIGNKDMLWSPYGIRSLSASDSFYLTGENYWRGHIWLNINYMLLKQLHHNSAVDPKSKELYTKLRTNLINTVFQDYRKTNYIWEQYGGTDGKGRRSHPFTGWTALITLIMSEIY